MRKLAPMHPGEVLREEFLKPFGIKPYTAARLLDVPRTRVERIVTERVGITADTALRLARLFGTSVEFWLNLQRDFDVLTARQKIGRGLGRIEPVERPMAGS